MGVSHPFDLVLAIPQWQGSARSENLHRGGIAAAEICQDFGPRCDVPIEGASVREHGINNWRALRLHIDATRRLLAERRPRRVLTAGGDCAVDVPVIDYLSGLYPDLTVIWIDAHLDANSPETSPSGSFHGMPVRMVLGDRPRAVAALLDYPVAPDRFFYVGARVGDPGDIAFALDHGLRSLPKGHRIDGPVHIHFDLDVLEPSEFPYLAYAEPGGLGPDQAIAIVEDLAAPGQVVGLTITEFAPSDSADATAGQAFIRRLCASVVKHRMSA